MSPLPPLRPCRKRGCRRLTRRGYCEPHRRAHSREDQAARGTAASRGYNARHRKWRKRILAKHPICQDPDQLHPKERRPATVADHIIPLAQLPEGAGWEDDNGQGLCASCHQVKTNRERDYHQ